MFYQASVNRDRPGRTGSPNVAKDWNCFKSLILTEPADHVEQYAGLLHQPVPTTGRRSRSPKRSRLGVWANRSGSTELAEVLGEVGSSTIVIVLAYNEVGNMMARTKGILLEELTWLGAEEVLRPETVVVIPIGAGCKEHGPHLKLKNDWVLAEYLKGELLRNAAVVIAPTVNYHYYPAFAEYPGTVTLRLETARDLIVDICISLARYGPHKFYALNTGVSTIEPLKLAAKILAVDGIELRYTDLLKLIEPAELSLKQEEGGTHADEIETSVMLFIAPSAVDMSKAVKDYNRESKGKLTRDPNGDGIYSPSGIYGDATLATRWKGEIVVQAIIRGILTDIAEMH